MDLSGYDQATLEGWWCDLASFRWPISFPAPTPPGFQGMTHYQKLNSPEFRAAWIAVHALVNPPVLAAHGWWWQYEKKAKPDDPPPKTETWRDRPPLL